MDTLRTRRELGWVPHVDVRDALAEVVTAMGQGRGADTPVLRARAFGASRVAEALRVAAGSVRR